MSAKFKAPRGTLDVLPAQQPVRRHITETAREALPRLLDGVRIAIARDDAFSFIYPANLGLLEALGARLAYFSPLANEPVPAPRSPLAAVPRPAVNSSSLMG